LQQLQGDADQTVAQYRSEHPSKRVVAVLPVGEKSNVQQAISNLIVTFENYMGNKANSKF
jgi:hypothetical protein